MNFRDIFKNSFLSNFSYSIDIETVCLNLILTAIFAVFIFLFTALLPERLSTLKASTSL